MAVLIPVDQHKAAPRGPLRANGQATEGVRGRIYLVGSSFSCLQSLVEVRNIVAYKEQGLPGGCAFDSAVWFWDMASASCRRIETRGLWQLLCPLNSTATPPFFVSRDISVKEGSANSVIF